MTLERFIAIAGATALSASALLAFGWGAWLFLVAGLLWGGFAMPRLADRERRWR